MKIAIFGDSYGSQHPLGNGLSWADFLANNYGIDVTNFSESGSCLHFSFNKFLENHEQFDKIIFLITGVGRLQIPLLVNDSKKYPSLKHITSYDAFLWNVKQNHPHDFLAYQSAVALKLYYAYIVDIKKEETMHTLMIEKIQSTRPDALVIPCFSLLGFDKNTKKTTLYNIDKLDFEKFRIRDDNSNFFKDNKKIVDIRHCHLNQENNLILSELLKQWIDTNDFDLDRDRRKFTVSRHPFEYYFRYKD